MLRRRRLGAELPRCREAAGHTQEQVSQHFEWHPAKVTRPGRSRGFVRLPAEVARYREAFDALWARSLDRRASIALIEAGLRR
jgi:Domain of unknown function (DUF5753)